MIYNFHKVVDDDRYCIQDVDMGGFTLSETQLHPDKATRGHAHPWPEIYIGIRGEGVIELDGGKQTLPIFAGSRLIVEGNVHHRVSTEGGVTFACFFTGIRDG